MAGVYHTREGLLFRIETDTPIRAWTGSGPRHIPADDTEIEGGTYLGIGLMLDMPTLSSLANGTAESAELKLGGIDRRLAGLIDAGAAEVEGVEVHIGRVKFDRKWRVISLDWTRGFLIERVALGIKQAGENSDGVSHTQSVTVFLGYGDGSRRRPTGGYWTNDQAGSGDLAFSGVPGMTAAATRPFPPKA